MRLRLTLFYLLLCFCAFPVHAQSPFGYGIKGGVALTDEYGMTQSTFGITSNGKDYIVGAFAELRFPFGIGFEGDALYQRVNLRNLPIIGAFTTGSYNSWEFPVLAKYRFRLPVPVVKPFVEAGPSFRAESSSLPDLSAAGVIFGGGVEFKLPVIRLSSDLRYTHWKSAGSAATTNPNANQVELLFGIAF